ncbi:kunitz-type serine protease inhibitor bitisilin-3 [Archocentrus centrarchus]|uniref:kunitz-type serine protease inhibitor bitisilin-3 n=1 Tax=Archocentrus centrarchus TaxID=63155 RepID=UPI0011E9C305|nr:kunitz-type serine protease inhibitor bitisilin-3-like [Archocentrus centrarchus]
MKHLLFLGIVCSAFQISHSSIPDFCLLAADEGDGLNFNFAVHYEVDKDQCSPFIYRGEGGNANRFQNEKDCLRNCSANSENVYPKNATKACLFKKENGGCNGKYLRYYYDSVNYKCRKFIWTGCLGNGNRFFDYLSCNATCAGIRADEGDSTEQEEDEPDTPIAIICGVVLAVIVVALIITVTVLTVKSKKKTAKKKAAGKSKDLQSEAPLQDRGIEMA